MRLCRVLFGCTSSPFLLQATLREHIEKMIDVDPEFVEKLIKSLHVDDLVSGGNSCIEVENFYMKCEQRLKMASFNLKKFQCSHPEVENYVYENSSFNSSNVNDSDTENKVLGITWDKQQDEFIFSFKRFTEQCLNAITKRDVLHCIASFYDPVGFVNPVLVKLKHFFQKLCIEKLDWDNELPTELLNEWLELCNPFQDAISIKLPRAYCFFLPSDPIIDIQLHGFCDASLKAYGACVYLRFTKLSGEVKCVLISSRSRIAPIKAQTIPRLELMGALLLAELIDCVKDELHFYTISSITAWIDSTVAYYWIVNNRNDQVFIRNRVAKILKILSKDTWSLVGTKDNPADIISRGLDPVQLLESSVWFNGPGFLYLSRELWPKFQHNGSNIISTQTLANIAEVKPIVHLPDVIPIHKYSTLLKLLSVTSYVLKFICNLKLRLPQAADDYIPDVADSTVSRKNVSSSLAANFTVSQQKGDVTKSVADSTVSRQNVSSSPAANFTVSQQKGDFTKAVADSTVSRPKENSPRKQYSLRSKVLVNQPDEKLVASQAPPLNEKNYSMGKDLVSTHEDNQTEDQDYDNGQIGNEHPIGKEYVDFVPAFTNILYTEDLNSSLTLWIKDLQANIDEKRLLTLKSQYNCFTDPQGVIRCEGRLRHSDLPYNQKFPILIDGNHPLVELLVLEAHEQVKHEGTKSTLTQLRTQYWLPKGRGIVRQLLHKCFRS